MYLKPWVLERQDATVAVPHTTDLNVLSARHLCVRTGCADTVKPPRHLCVRTGCADSAKPPLVLRRVTQKQTTGVDRSFALSWRVYIRGHIVSSHSKRIIAQFMAACCGKSKTEDAFLGESAVMPSAEEQNEPCSLSLQYVRHTVCDVSSHKEDSATDVSEDQCVDEPKVSRQCV